MNEGDVKDKIGHSEIGLRTFLVWSAIICVTCIGGTYQFTRSQLGDHIESLNERIKAKDEKIVELTQKAKAPAPLAALDIPTSLEQKLSPEIKQEVKEVETKRAEVIAKILAADATVFSPLSEVASLAKLLNSTAKEDRIKAVLGFHEIRDKSTGLYLSEYFFSHQEEATSGLMPSIGKWIRLFENFGESAGLSFKLNLMQRGSDFDARVAYERLLDLVVDKEMDIASIESDLRMMAITASNPLHRTWAKVLISKNEERKLDQTRGSCDRRSILGVLLDVEDYLHRNLPDKETTVTPELQSNKVQREN